MMRIRGFLLVEAIIFVFIMILSFVFMSKVMLSYSKMNHDSIVQMHELKLTNEFAPGHTKKFDEYCSKYNIKIINKSRCAAEVEMHNKRYKIQMNSTQDGYDWITI